MIGNKNPLVQKTPARKNHTKPNRGKIRHENLWIRKLI